MEIRLRLLSAIGAKYMQPVGLDSLKLTGQSQEQISDLKLGLNGELTFLGSDYKYLRNLDASEYRDKEINVLIEERFQNSWRTKREGYLLLREASFDEDRCTCKTKIQLYDKYTSLNDKLDVEFNLFLITTFRYRATHSTITTDITNGVLVFEALSKMLETTIGITNIRSNFFQWNPDDTTYTIGNSTKLKKLILFQKSDVVRRGIVGYSEATIMTITLKQLLYDLCTLFNLSYWIDVNGAFRLEHVSYRTRAQTLDLTLPKYTEYVRGYNNWKYNSNDIYHQEIFESGQSISPDFCKSYITYDNGYVPGIETKTKEYSVSLITDIKSTSDLDGTDNNADYSGIVIVAVDDTDAIQDEAGVITLTVVANNVLAWQQLIRYYYSYDRPFKSGTITSESLVPYSDVLTFLTIKRNRIQSGITIKLCSDEDSLFDPSGSVLTILGSGWIDKFDYSFQRNLLTLDLIYPNREDYLIDPPMVADDNYTAYINTHFDSAALGKPSLISNDTGVVSAFPETKKTSKGGLVTIFSNGQFTYDPPAGFYGADQFRYGAIKANGNAAIGTALVGVRPVNLYVHYLDKIEGLSGASTKYAAYALWYLDSALTSPIDVTGFNITVKYTDGITVVNVPAVGYATLLTTHIGTPSSYTLYPDPDYTII